MNTIQITPSQAWQKLVDGNARFTSAQMANPNQDATRRGEVVGGQNPFAVVLGCSDSRVPVEVLFDQGIGDIFVIRTAGHTLDDAVLGSLEYGVNVAGASVLVVLGHDHCGAVQAAAGSSHGHEPTGYIKDVVDKVMPSIATLLEIGEPADLEAAHVHSTMELLRKTSSALADAVDEGRCAIVGAKYALASDGRVDLLAIDGSLS